MDPITIASIVVSLASRSVSTANTLYTIRERYTHAQTTIMAICSECNVLSTSLGHIKGLVDQHHEVLRANLQSREELRTVFESSLMGCMLVLSVLEEEVQALGPSSPSMRARVAMLWKDKVMKDLLIQIRGQQAALNLVIQAIQL